jgi:hypothetical protein
MKKVISLLIFLFLIGCAKQGNSPYILYEKQLADLNNRHRTTAKIVIGSVFSVNRENIEKILKQALSDLQKDDPDLDAVIIWAYKDRSELNQTFTLGKLEWSKDKKGWDGKQKLDKEIIIEMR